MPLRERKNIAFFTLVTPFCKPLKFGEREREREGERERERERKRERIRLCTPKLIYYIKLK